MYTHTYTYINYYIHSYFRCFSDLDRNEGVPKWGVTGLSALLEMGSNECGSRKV